MSAANPFAQPTSGTFTGTTSATTQPFTNGHAEVDPNLAQAQPQEELPPLPAIDINDPLLTSEALTVQEGDAFAEPAPPPDRIYRVQLKLRGVAADDYKLNGRARDITPFLAGGEKAPWVPETILDKQTGQAVGMYAKTKVDVQIHDPAFPQYEGLYLQIPFGGWLDTREGRNHGPSKIMTILNLAGNRPSTGKPWLDRGITYGHKAMMEIFLQYLAGEPELRCQSEWTWNCRACGDEARAKGKFANSIDGMNKFYLIAGKPGVYNHELRCPVTPAHGYSKARAQVGQFFGLDSK